MRRIYESGALHRDDEEPLVPTERDAKPEAMRSVDAAAWSHRLVPDWLRYRAISVDVEASRDVYPDDVPVSFRVTMTNAMPFPVTVPTRSPRLWTWYVDGLARASHVDDVPAEGSAIGFDRGETKRFRRRWDRLFRVSDDEWEPAPAGEYTIGAGLSVADAAARGVYSETAVTLETE